MPADSRFTLLQDTQTGRQALDEVGTAQYIVIHFSDGRYAVVKPDDLRRKLTMWKMMDAPLKDVPPNIMAPHLVEVISNDDPGLEGKIKALKTGQALVVTAAGEYDGLVVGGQVFRGGNPRMDGAKGPGVLSAGNEPPGSTESKPQDRFINVEVRDRAGQIFPAKEKPLQLEQTYRLLFDIDNVIRAESLVTERFSHEKAFSAGEEEIELTVRLSSDDFKIRPEQQTLYVPRAGKSINTAEFNIQPLHDGPGVINAVFLKDNNFIQVMTLKFVIGEIFTYKAVGRDINGAMAARGELSSTTGSSVKGLEALAARDVSLTILNTGAAFQLILISPGVAATATLPIKLPELKDITSQARDKLLEIVNYKEDGKVFYQQSLDIPPEINEFALQQLAEAGFRLYQRIFFGPSADEQTKNLGRKLRELAQKEQLKIQIFSQDFVLPWGLLYMADRFDPNNVNPQLFLGLKHIIEHIPLQQSMRVTDNRVDGSRGLSVSLNVNTDIDKQMGVSLIGDQLQYWEALKAGGTKVSLVTRKTAPEVTSALANPETPDQVLYFYCHGLASDVDKAGGVSAATLVLTGNKWLTLNDLNLYAPQDDQLLNAPLVFINACESAQLSPLVYDGFVPYFMSKGARGVIGTEVKTPALFAVEWARRFFDRFLKGEALGEIFLGLRKEFYEQNHNLMGLLYALYVDGDTRIEPALKT